MDPARRKRINLYKKIIMAVVILSILIPLVLCVVLLGQVFSLKNEIESLDAFQNSIFADMQSMNYGETEKQSVQNEGGEDGASLLIDEGQQQQTLGTGDKSQSSIIETPPDAPKESPASDNDTEKQDTTSLEADAMPEAALQTTPEETTTEDNRKKVYLTFDDGPSSNTDAILDILKEYNAKATFFVNGKNSAVYAGQYKRIVEEGHTLAMHSYTHVYADVYASVDAFLDDMHRLRDYLYELTGVESCIYRFPGGSSNTISKIDIREFGRALAEEGIVYFDWNVSSGDAVSPAKSADEIYDSVVSGVVKKKTPVVLMHDMKSKKTTVEALPRILQFLVDNDYNIAALDSSSELVQHRKID